MVIKERGFGGLVRYYRKLKKLSQIKLSLEIFVDNSIISRIENGNLIPHRATVDRISEALKLSENEQNEFYHAYTQAIIAKEGLSIKQIYLNDDEAIKLASDHVRDTRKLRILGMPRLAVAKSEDRIELLNKLSVRTHNASARKELYKYLTQLLMEVSKSYMDYLLPREVWDFMEPLIKYQEKVAKEIQTPAALMMAEMSKEAALYVSKDYDKAHKIGIQLHSNLRHLDGYWHSEVIRASAINAGYMNDEKTVNNLTNDITYFVQEEGFNDHMNTSFLLEGLARAQGFVNDRRVLTTIEKAWRHIEYGKKAGNHSVFRTVQLIRTQLKIMQKLGINDVVTIEKIGKKGLILCEEMGYLRYEKEIRQLLGIALNCEQ